MGEGLTSGEEGLRAGEEGPTIGGRLKGGFNVPVGRGRPESGGGGMLPLVEQSVGWGRGANVPFGGKWG